MLIVPPAPPYAGFIGRLVERYLAIEQVRLGDRLQLRWSLDPNARTTRLPTLMWQPPVENAIRHGIALREAPGQGTRVRVARDRLALARESLG